MSEVYAQGQPSAQVDPVEQGQQKLAQLFEQQQKYLENARIEAQKIYPNDQNQQMQYLSQLQYNNPFTAQIKYQEKEVKNLDMQKKGLNPDGSPIAPEFKTILDAEGNLPEKYKLISQLLDPNTLEGYNMLKQIATETGPSKYAQTANKQAELSRQDTIDAAQRAAGAGVATARSNLAMRGGASAGARERLEGDAQMGLMGAKQGAYRQTGNQLLDIMKDDETRKRQALTQFGEAEGKIALGNNALTNQDRQFNLNNILKEEDMRRNYNQDTYKQKLDQWGAIKQAEATRNSGGGGK